MVRMGALVVVRMFVAIGVVMDRKVRSSPATSASTECRGRSRRPVPCALEAVPEGTVTRASTMAVRL